MKIKKPFLVILGVILLLNMFKISIPFLADTSNNATDLSSYPKFVPLVEGTPSATSTTFTLRKYEAGTEVSLYIFEAGDARKAEELADNLHDAIDSFTGTVDRVGNLRVPIPYYKNEVVLTIGTDINGRTLAFESIIGDSTLKATDTPTASVNATGTMISGQSFPHATIYILDASKNYVLAQTTANPSGGYSTSLPFAMTNGEQLHVVARSNNKSDSAFAPAQAPVIVQQQEGYLDISYVNEAGQSIQAGYQEKGILGQTFTATAPTITSYDLVSDATQVGTFSDPASKIEFIYKAKSTTPTPTSGTITVNYVNENNEAITSSQTFTGTLNSTKTLNALEIEGYELADEATKTASFKNPAQEVAFQYKAIQNQSTITVHFVDEQGVALENVPPLTLSGKEKDDYVITVPTAQQYPILENYTLVPNQALKGQFKNTDEKITIQFEKNAVISNGSIIVKYLDENNEAIAAEQTFTGTLDDNKTLNALSIEGYELVGDATATASFTNPAQVVTFNYQMIKKEATVIVRYVDEQDQPLMTNVILTGKVGEPFTLAAQLFDNYNLIQSPASLTGTYTEQQQVFTFNYEAIKASITVQHLTTLNTVLLEETLTGRIGESYTTTAKSFNDYSLIISPTNATGTFAVENQPITYYYERVIIPVLPPVTEPNPVTPLPPVNQPEPETVTPVPPVNQPEPNPVTPVPPVNQPEPETVTPVPPVKQPEPEPQTEEPNEALPEAINPEPQNVESDVAINPQPQTNGKQDFEQSTNEDANSGYLGNENDQYKNSVTSSTNQQNVLAQSSSALPQTNGQANTFYTIFGAVLLLLATIFLVKRRSTIK